MGYKEWKAKRKMKKAGIETYNNGKKSANGKAKAKGVAKAVGRGLAKIGSAGASAAKKAYEHEKKIKSGEKVLVGVNSFIVDEKEKELSLYEMDPEVSKRQIERLQQVKTERDNKQVESTLEELRQAANGGENIMLPLIYAVKAYATVGEITDVLRDVFGSFKEPVQI